MTNLNAGLLGPAIRWSWAGLGVGVVGWIMLLAWSVGGDVFMSNEFHRLSTTSLAILILGSLMVQLTARLIRGQRKVTALLDVPRHGYAEGFADGLARRPAVSGRHLSMVDGPDAS